MFFSLNPNILPQIRLINSVTIDLPYIHKRRKANEYILYIIRKGNMYIIEDGKKYVLTEGDFFLLDPSYVHEGYKAAYCEYFYIHFQHDQIYKTENMPKDLVIQKVLESRNDYLQSNSFSSHPIVLSLRIFATSWRSSRNNFSRIYPKKLKPNLPTK